MTDSAKKSSKASIHSNNSADQKWIAVKRPPRLIVLENNYDYAAPMLLAALVSRLPALDFTQFYYEGCERLDAEEDKLKETEVVLKSSYNLDFSADAAAIKKCLIEANIHSDSVNLVLREKHLSTFLRNLKAIGIEYVPIDSRYCRELEKMQQLHPVRDTMMTNAYISAEHNVFGLHGIAHLTEFMQIISDSNVYATKQDAYNDYLFVYPFAAVRDIPLTELQAFSALPFKFMFFDLATDNLEESCTKVLNALASSTKILNIKQLENAKKTLEKKLLYEFYALSQEIKETKKEKLEGPLADTGKTPKSPEPKEAKTEVPAITGSLNTRM